MRTELFSHPKYRDGGALGDDVALVLPGIVYGVFDGATDPRGTVVDGMGTGRLAALVVAAQMASLAMDSAVAHMPGEQIVERLSHALKRKNDALNLPIPPSTTLAVVLDCGDSWRFLLLGDSGIRLNGAELIRNEKIIDDVSTFARVATFNDLRKKFDDVDEVEQLARTSIFLGFENAIAKNLMSSARAQDIIEETIEATGLHHAVDNVTTFLMGGVETQHLFGNRTGNPLCFDTMNGTTPQLGELTDFVRPKAAVTSIEIFSDGYPSLPQDVSIFAWEAAFKAAEEEDFHKTGRFATVKGSTRQEFFDDRTVLIVS